MREKVYLIFEENMRLDLKQTLEQTCNLEAKNIIFYYGFDTFYILKLSCERVWDLKQIALSFYYNFWAQQCGI